MWGDYIFVGFFCVDCVGGWVFIFFVVLLSIWRNDNELLDKQSRQSLKEGPSTVRTISQMLTGR